MAKHIVTAPLIVVYNGTTPTRVRYGAEVPEYASKEQLAQLLDAGLVEKVVEKVVEKQAPTDPAKMNAAQLKAYASEKGIDVGDASKVDELREVIAKALAAGDSSPASPSEKQE